MSQLVMRPELVTGIASIDAQHGVLIDCFNELSRAVGNHEPRDLVDLALRAMIHSTRAHFVHEERLLEESAFPGLDQHREEHLELLRQVEQYEQRYRAGTLELTPHMMVLLKDWLVDHILHSDKAFAPHLAQAADSA